MKKNIKNKNSKKNNKGAGKKKILQNKNLDCVFNSSIFLPLSKGKFCLSKL